MSRYILYGLQEAQDLPNKLKDPVIQSYQVIDGLLRKSTDKSDKWMTYIKQLREKVAECKQTKAFKDLEQLSNRIREQVMESLCSELKETISTAIVQLQMNIEIHLKPGEPRSTILETLQSMDHLATTNHLDYETLKQIQSLLEGVRHAACINDQQLLIDIQNEIMELSNTSLN